MNLKSPFVLLMEFIFGIAMITLSILVMVFNHEFTISEIVFIIGICLIGILYANLPKTDKPAINTKQIDKNLQNLNNILWGEEKSQEIQIKKCPVCNFPMHFEGVFWEAYTTERKRSPVRVYRCKKCGHRAAE